MDPCMHPSTSLHIQGTSSGVVRPAMLSGSHSPSQPAMHPAPNHHQQQALHLNRRSQLAMLASPLLLPPLVAPQTAHAAEGPEASIPNYSAVGPCTPVRLPTLEHTCTTCGAAADRSRVRIQAWYPKGSARAGLQPPFPLAVLTSGFLIGSDQYYSYAERLASWGYCVLTYDVNQQALDPLSDTVCVAMLRDLIEWARSAQPLASVTNTDQVFLIGHSRGAKISTLTATVEPRIKSLFLMDPVDVTVYAPLAPEYPSATANLSSMTPPLLPRIYSPPPLAILGSALGGDCVPSNSNYALYYEAAPGAAFEAVLSDAGHLQFLDSRGSNLLDAVCAAGPVADGTVAEISKALMVAWAEATLRAPPSSPAAPSGLRFGVGPDGEVVAGEFPAIDALTQLYSAIKDAKRKTGIELNIETRAKNFIVDQF